MDQWMRRPAGTDAVSAHDTSGHVAPHHAGVPFAPPVPGTAVPFAHEVASLDARQHQPQEASPPRRHPLGHLHQPAVIPGWWLLVAFGVLVILAPLVPAYAGSGAGPHSVRFVDVLPQILIGTASVGAGYAARAGYHTAFAFGAGFLLFWSQVLVWVFVLAHANISLSGAFGTEISVGPGLVLFGLSGLAGLFAVVPGIGAAVAADATRCHPLVGVAGAVGVVLYLVGILDRETFQSGPFDGDGWSDLIALVFIGIPVLAALLLLISRTAAAAAFLAGAMFLPFVTWFATSVGGRASGLSLFDARTGWGLVISTVAGIIGMAMASERVMVVSGRRTTVPANASAVGTIGVVIVLVLSIVALANHAGR